MAHVTSARSGQDTVFDVDVEKLARVYAQGGLEAAGDFAAQERFVDELSQLDTEVLRKNPELEKLFASALVSHDEKLAFLERVFSNRLSPSVLTFLKVIGRHGRLGILRPIIRNARKQWDVRQNQVAVQLELAHQIDEALKQQLIDLIAQRLNTKPVVTVEINPDLIAGFVVRAGDRVFDASVRTNLERARDTMIHKAVEKISERSTRFYQPDED